MSSYTAAQYREQLRITRIGNRANATGLCAVCERRPLKFYPDGVRGITCGADECYHKWLRFRPEQPAMAGKDDNNG
jgi:hypothetical protein